jgi:hypothetical protein
MFLIDWAQANERKIMRTWVAYNHTVHYLVDLDDKEVVAVEIPSWMNTFEEPGMVWSEDDRSTLPLTETLEDAMIEVLENSPMPEPYWG